MEPKKSSVKSDIQYEYWDERQKERHSEHSELESDERSGVEKCRKDSKLASGNELDELRQE